MIKTEKEEQGSYFFFQIVQSAAALDQYKIVKNEYKDIINTKKSKYLETRGNMLSEAAND